jgi:hypothetical protein
MSKRLARAGAQGELYITRHDGPIPAGAVAVPAEGGHVIVGHSETGHHHVMTAERTTMYRLPEEIYELFLVVSAPDELTHLRSFDTHESIAFDPGMYRVRRQREYTPEGWRRAAD